MFHIKNTNMNRIISNLKALLTRYHQARQQADQLIDAYLRRLLQANWLPPEEEKEDR